MPEHYSPDETERTRKLFQVIREWAETRNDITIIGGWAVHHHVQPVHAMQSRDVDLVLHSEGALKTLLSSLSSWGLKLRQKSRKTFADAHFTDENPMNFRLDIFISEPNDTWLRLFHRQGAANIKTAPRELFPDIEWVLQDKLSTIPSRRGTGVDDKRAKDLIDIHHLVFYNRLTKPSRDLLHAVEPDTRKIARTFLDQAMVTHPEYRDDLQTLSKWLEA